ncbi:MAG TPA: IS4 family transposase [Herpetosiphonaceae bacterium]|nr:IS4 family transposase [Herpetosiphonaceae bacterium]
MGFTIREIDAECKFSQAVTVEALARAIPQRAIYQALAQHGVAAERERKLTLVLTVWLVIALHLYPTVSIAGVLRKLARGLRFIWPDPAVPLPTDSALAYRRAQLGAPPVVTLFKQVCQPIATPQTRGAFLFGLRLMAIDGTTEDVPDTPANAAMFGRHTSARGASAFPQLQGVYLVECGTHCVVDAGFWPCHTSERVGGFRLLRSVGRGMLLLWDRGFHDFDMVGATRRRGAHVLSRLPAGVKPQVLRSLPDGSVLAALLPSEDARRRRGERILVRVITYTITDPTLPGYGEEHRVITTLLNPRWAPAHAVACAYHERWEIEIVIDEIDTHQRLVGRTLRSLTPAGVIQELYGVLLAHYAVRVLMHAAALQADLDPDRLSFVHALEVVRDAVSEFQMVAVEQQGALYVRMLQDIAAKRLPVRRTRSNARVVKRKMSNFKLKRAEHYRPPTPRGTFADAVQVQPPPMLELPPRQQANLKGAFVELRQREPILI